MIVKDEEGKELFIEGSERLQSAYNIRAFRVESISPMKAVILAPPNMKNLTYDDLLLIIRLAMEAGEELESLGFEVEY